MCPQQIMPLPDKKVLHFIFIHGPLAREFRAIGSNKLQGRVKADGKG